MELTRPATLDEMVDGRGGLRPHWRTVLSAACTVIAAVARDCHADSVDAIAAHELSIDQAMTYRADFRSNTTLSQPSANTLAVRRSRRRRSAND